MHVWLSLIMFQSVLYAPRPGVLPPNWSPNATKHSERARRH
jgi:hypothetical protein